MRRVVVGTAGHIDHGKTRLVEALTGIDCDRWQEEKSRGITIDLGFAVLREGDLQVGFIDVPGHEKFLHNALAGLGGIRLMLLVVAADEGVKPQTREHLAICSLLGIPAGVVALTKTDLVSPDLVELAHLEVDELLSDTPFAGSPIHAVSSVSGKGIDELRSTLVEVGGRHETTADPDFPARLPLDRAFHLKGLGVVVTGTLAAGSVAPGDTLEILPAGRPVRVRSIQVHGETRERALAGERTSLQITGAGLENLARGSQLTTPGAFTAGRRLLARFRLLPEAPDTISGWIPVRLHAYSSQVLGRMRPLAGEELGPGEESEMEIRLAAPLVAVRGDLVIVCRPSPATTLGGGKILDPAWRAYRGAALRKALQALGGDREAALAFWAEETGEAGLEEPDLARRLGERVESVAGNLQALAGEGALLRVEAGQGHGRRWISPSVYRRLARRAERVLAAYFERDRLAHGISKAEAMRRILPGRAAGLASVYLDWLEKQGILVIAGDRIDIPDRRVELTGEESKLGRAVIDGFERGGLTPPSPGELRQDLEAKTQILDGVIRFLVDRGRLVKLPSGLILAATAVEELEKGLKASGWERFTVAQFKDLFGLSRKWAIPLLEHLDSTGVTRRIGDERLIVGR